MIKTDQTPQVSVIIPIYNMEKYLARCLDSVVNQTLKDIEIICVDDGSEDRSPEILSQYAVKDERIKVITQANRGVSCARNAGLESAKGRYIGFVDSDDWIEPETYEMALGKMTEYPDVGFVCWGIRGVPGEDGESFLKHKKPYMTAIEGKRELNDYICLLTKENACDKLFKREIIQQNNIRFPQEILFGEDRCFVWCYFASCRYAYFLDRYFYCYFKRKNSATGLSEQKKFHIYTNFELLGWEYIYCFFRRAQILESKKKLLEKLFIKLYCIELKNSPQPKKVLAHAEELKEKYGLNTIDLAEIPLDGKLRFTFLEKIFSVKNSFDGTHKVICVLGLKLSIRKPNPRRCT